MKKIELGIILALLFMPMVGAAADFNVPSFKEGWNILPPGVTGLALKVLGVIVTLVILIAIGSLLVGGGEYAVGRVSSNTGQSSGGMSRIVKAVGSVILVIAGISLILWLVA